MKEIDIKVANLSAKNLIMTKLYTNGSLSVTEYNERSSEINAKLAELRADRKKLIGEEQNNQVTEINELNEIIQNTPFISEFNEEIFNATVEKIIVGSDNVITFCLVGGLKVEEEG